jgi:hypothetical protein
MYTSDQVVSSTVAQMLHCLYPPSAIDIPGNRMAQTRKRHLFVSLIIDDRAACRNLHRAAPTSTRSLFSRSRCYPTSGPFHTAKRAHAQSTSIRFSHCREREYEKLDSERRGFYARCTTSQALSLAIPKQVRKEDTVCQPQTRSPQEEKKKRRGPSVLLVHQTIARE